MKHSKPNVVSAVAAFLFLAFVALHPIHAATHISRLITADLSLKQPFDTRSQITLQSIAADGLVTIRAADGSISMARVGEEFRDAQGQRLSTLCDLVSVSAAKDSVVIRYRIRVYVHSTETPPKAKDGK